MESVRQFRKPSVARLPRLAARFAHSLRSFAAVLASPGFAERPRPFSPPGERLVHRAKQRPDPAYL